jgi:two-component system sensor histidine kinase KdpD
MKTRSPSNWQRARYLLAAVLCVLTTLAAVPLRELLDLANIVMIFLLTVFVTAVRLGAGRR